MFQLTQRGHQRADVPSTVTAAVQIGAERFKVGTLASEVALEPGNIFDAEAATAVSARSPRSRRSAGGVFRLSQTTRASCHTFLQRLHVAHQVSQPFQTLRGRRVAGLVKRCQHGGQPLAQLIERCADLRLQTQQVLGLEILERGGGTLDSLG